ncbi:HD domain-containing phosphohydrolase [Elusimicrobiota bacterium]
MEIFTKKKPLVLIADDDQADTAILGQLMISQGYDIIAVNDGKTALNNILAKKPDLILVDNYMPGMTGREICREVKSNPSLRLIPIIIITGYIGPTEKLKSIEVGADDFVSKPFKSIELITRVKALLHAKFLNDDLDSSEAVIFSLASAIEAKDKYTQGHTERVSRLSLLVGHQLMLPEEEQKALYKGGILHDIGKIAVPDAILNKPEKLDVSEFEMVKTHPERGEKICQHLNSIRPALDIIRSHHEKADGSGYPDRLIGDQIPLIARIMSVIDVYDALTSDRSYRPAMSQGKAFEIIDNETEMGWWDKKVVKETKKIISRA